MKVIIIVIAMISLILAGSIIVLNLQQPPQVSQSWCTSQTRFFPDIINIWAILPIFLVGFSLACIGYAYASSLPDDKKPDGVCPHYNIEKNGLCNMLPNSEKCIGYSKCMTLRKW